MKRHDAHVQKRYPSATIVFWLRCLVLKCREMKCPRGSKKVFQWREMNFLSAIWTATFQRFFCVVVEGVLSHIEIFEIFPN